MTDLIHEYPAQIIVILFVLILLLLIVIIVQRGTIVGQIGYIEKQTELAEKREEEIVKYCNNYTAACRETYGDYATNAFKSTRYIYKRFREYCDWVNNYYPEVNDQYDKYYKAKQNLENT